MYCIYWIISESRSKTYVGYSGNLINRMEQHRRGEVKSTKNFGNFSYQILEKIDTVSEAKKRERYWKSGAGRRKLKNLFNKAPSSSG